MATGTDARFAAIHEDFLSCKICFEELDVPKSLPCLHTFCLKCIEQHARRNTQPNSRFACPLCRKECQIPEKGIQDFPTNFMIQGLKDVVPIPGEEDEREPTIDISTLQDHLEMWNINCREITSKINHIQATKQKLKEEANTLYSKIEKKLKDEKKSIHEEIDRCFGKETELKKCLAKVKEFEEQVNDTKKGLEYYQSSKNLSKSSQTLQKKYSQLTKAMITTPSKTRLAVSEDLMWTVMQRPIAKLQKDMDPSNIKCSLISEFSVKWNSGDIAAVRGLLCIQKTIYALTYEVENTYVKMFDTQGLFLGCFKDRCNYEIPRAFCCLSDDTIAVSYEDTDTIKVFDLEGNFRRKITMDITNAILAALPDGTIAVGQAEEECIDIYTQNFKRRSDKKRIICGTRPLFINGNKDVLFFSNIESLYSCDYKEDLVYNLSETIANFEPRGMCMDKWGNLLVTNTRYSKIYIFSMDQVSKRFQFKKVLLDQENNNIHKLGAVCFSTDNVLIGGQENGKIKVFSYT